jgi:hypothetical protein
MCLAQTLAMSLAFMKPRGGTDDDSLIAELSGIDC